MRRLRLVVVGVLLAALAGCAPSDPPPPPLHGDLTIFASTSLTDAFTSIERGFETTYPSLRITLTFGPDTELAKLTAAGPPPDVLVLEGPGPLAQAGPVGTPVRFARNQLVLVVPAANPKSIGRLPDIGRPDVRVALCQASEPCGGITTAVLLAAGVPAPEAALRVGDVRAALASVTKGDADAALVYRSDARAAGDAVATVEFAESRTDLAQYQAVTPAGATNPAAADAFLTYLTNQSTVDAFTGSGFLPPV
jgi:molybdate transport system substrate-binding protein